MSKSEEWITQNFESLVSKYGGKYIGVVDEQIISVAFSPREILENAKKLGRKEEEVSLLKVPTEEELLCVLWSSNMPFIDVEMCPVSRTYLIIPDAIF